MDEDEIKNSLISKGASPLLISKNLAEVQANKVSMNKPDMIVLGKGITNGYFPMGACLINEKIEKSVTMFNHGFTYSGHPASCAAGLATLAIYNEQDTYKYKLCISCL